MPPNKSLIYKKYTPGWPVPGEHIAVENRPFDLEAAPAPGGMTVRNLYLSLDPYARGQMREPNSSATYSIPWVESEPAVLTAFSTVLKSDNPTFEPGTYVYVMTHAAEYASLSAEFAAMSVPLPPLPDGVDIQPPAILCALGVSGLAAYVSFFEFVKRPQCHGKTMFVSAAAGGVGQIVGQLGKIHGLKVVGSTGSDDKVDFVVRELGFDGAWNYKTEKTSAALRRLAPEGLDYYYDNVAGEQLEAALAHMKDFGTIISSGGISQYNKLENEIYGVKTLHYFFLKRLSMHGFICSDPPLLSKYMATFGEDMVRWLVEGRLKTKEEVIQGIENAPEAYIKMWKGDKFGKLVLQM
ncbi:hypothetical protein F4801DRAFT_70590 [Xylaria longipes]|nr:hypothetical protein F4801DRAFT_70590 [Xylaria longipes]